MRLNFWIFCWNYWKANLLSFSPWNFEACSNNRDSLAAGLPSWLRGKESSCSGDSLLCRRHRFDPWVRKIPGEGNGNPLQYSCLENPMDSGIWQAIVHGVAKGHDFTTKPVSSSKQDCLMWVGVPITPDGKAELELEIQNPDCPVWISYQFCDPMNSLSFFFFGRQVWAGLLSLVTAKV